MAPPLWSTLVGLSLAKKVTVLIAAKLYGIPRLYRRSQKVVRWLIRDPAGRNLWASRARTSFRLPQNVARAWHGQQPIPTSFAFPGPLAVGVVEGTRSAAAAAPSFASAPMFQASRRRMQDRLAANKQRLRAAHAQWKLRGKALTQRGLQQLQRYGGQAQPSVYVEAAAMHFIREARQAYQFVPAIAMH